MINKKKLQFIKLCVIFGAVVLLALFNEWSKPQAMETNNSMMTGSMGSMMSSMHLSNLKLSDLLYQEEMQENSSNMSSHHAKQETELSRVHYFTTMSIVLLLPLIAAGTVFLSIVWLK